MTNRAGNDKGGVIPDIGVVIPDSVNVIPDSIRDPVPRHDWIAGQARNDNQRQAMTTRGPQ